MTIFTEYAKNDVEDILIRIKVYNRGTDGAYIALLPTLWLRNLWSFGMMREQPKIYLEEGGEDFGHAKADHYWEGDHHFYFEKPVRTLFTENETNTGRLYGQPNKTPYVKDAFHTAVQQQKFDLLEKKNSGSKFAPMYEFNVEGNNSVTVKLRLSKHHIDKCSFDISFDEVFEQRIKEADEFYASITTATDNGLIQIQRQAFAGMLWSKQYFHIDIPRWLNGDPGQPPPPEKRKHGRNHNWHSLNNEDVISMPDKWEYPWYAAWDLAFHCVPLSMIDSDFAKSQLILFLREWYSIRMGNCQHMNGPSVM